MIKKILFTALTLMLCAFVYTQQAVDILPKDDRWQPTHDIIAYEGDDLFFLINGGADLYYEYGFADVAAANYSINDSGSLYTEVYRMDSDDAAFGIFSLRARNVVPHHKTEDGTYAMGSDYIHVWKNNFYFYISASGIETDEISKMNQLTEAIMNNIPGKESIPEIKNQLPDNYSGFAYIKGPIALSNVYSFGHRDIFNIKEGLWYEHNDKQVLKFFYDDNEQAANTFKNATDNLKSTQRLTNMKVSDKSFTGIDRQSKVVEGKVENNTIIIEIAAKPVMMD